MPPFAFLSFYLSFFFFFHFWFLFVLQGGVCVCNCQKHTARRGEEMELKVDWVTTWHQGTCQRGPRSPYIPNVGPGAPTSAAPFRTPLPRLFDMLIVAVGRLELAREQKLSEGWHVTKLQTSKPGLKGSVLIQQNKFAFYNAEEKIPTN